MIEVSKAASFETITFDIDITVNIKKYDKSKYLVGYKIKLCFDRMKYDSDLLY
jgi:hypothetical protein